MKTVIYMWLLVSLISCQNINEYEIPSANPFLPNIWVTKKAIMAEGESPSHSNLDNYSFWRITKNDIIMIFSFQKNDVVSKHCIFKGENDILEFMDKYQLCYINQELNLVQSQKTGFVFELKMDSSPEQGIHLIYDYPNQKINLSNSRLCRLQDVQDSLLHLNIDK